jgi:phage gpG-like protein
MAKKRLGIIQSRGLGDLVIALPIAGHYHKEGWDIYWPVVDSFLPSMQKVAPWVKWIPISYDAPGLYFYDVPMERLKNFKCDEILPLYQHLSNHDFSKEKYFQYTSFDQYKYIRAGVPFLEKWRLADYITRDPDREQALYDRIVTNPNYAVLHLEGSDHTAQFDRSIIPKDWQIIEISDQPDTLLFDWLKIVEGAQSLIMVDSVWANIVDQMGLGSDRYFIQRSHIGLTPVHGQDWTWL